MHRYQEEEKDDKYIELVVVAVVVDREAEEDYPEEVVEAAEVDREAEEIIRKSST